MGNVFEDILCSVEAVGAAAGFQNGESSQQPLMTLWRAFHCTASEPTAYADCYYTVKGHQQSFFLE